MEKFWLCFVPLFVAVDALGTLPIFVGMVEGIKRRSVRRVLAQSVLTAAAVALFFLALGTGFLRLLGITVADFMVAGGVLLFVIAMADLLGSTQGQGGGKHDMETVGAVPLGVPLIAGPALLTSSLILLQQHGIVPTGAAIIANIALAGLIFLFAETIGRVLGRAGSKTIAKISNLLLASIAVMIIRKGFVMIVTQAVVGSPGRG
jgi:multiple antibiotic resistance protein